METSWQSRPKGKEKEKESGRDSGARLQRPPMAAEFALLSTSLLVVTKLPVPLLIYASAVLPSILFRSASTSMLQTRWLSDLLVQRLQRMWRGSWPMWPLCRLWVGWFLRREACQNGFFAERLVKTH